MATKLFSFISILALSISVASAAQSSKKKTANYRGLASVAPGTSITPSMGQGEQMLERVTGSRPGFLRSSSRNSGFVKVGGVCRGTNGLTYTLQDKDYTDCVSAQSRLAPGASVNDYFGPAQRQAGVGVLVGN